MKTWELIEQLQGRDPSGEVVLTLSGDGFKYARNFDLSPPAHRRVILEADAEDIGVDTGELEDEIKALKRPLPAIPTMEEAIELVAAHARAAVICHAAGRRHVAEAADKQRKAARKLLAAITREQPTEAEVERTAR